MSGGVRLDVVDLRKTYTLGPHEVEVLRGISFSLRAGESLSVLGPSGSGKSTLLHIVGTLDRPTSGRVEIEGDSPHELPEPALAAFRNRRIGFVFQDHHLLPQYSVLENVLLPSWVGREGRSEAALRGRRLLDRVGLSHRLEHRPAELSGGERQRAAVARALLRRPSLLLCDEPTGNLDAASAEAVVSLLYELHQEESSILIVVTHSADVAARSARRIRLVEGVCSAA
ncbi:MAG TPA: ABC transporter ATP-binding protein [Candidatus Polarisedimenticolia bacterium]|nr:ABC transporter ATP-binding protein [Candidatus Polarisedimenticolia bacterium]